jgi:hypothetical protein
MALCTYWESNSKSKGMIPVEPSAGEPLRPPSYASEVAPGVSSPYIDTRLNRVLRVPLMLWGTLIFLIGMASYLFGVLIALPCHLFARQGLLRFDEALVWYSGIPTLCGLVLIGFDLFILLPYKRDSAPRFGAPDVEDRSVTVALTAYNDEDSIGPAVEDFRLNPSVRRVIVVDNNSKDSTAERARQAGATVFVEEKAGYGYCVHRCLSEALRLADGGYIVLCEGDMTFRSHDIEKLLAYASHASIVNGTRIVEQLRERVTQLSTFMYYGNFFVGKLLEIKHLGKGTFTDVGTTYKLLHKEALARLLPNLNASINLEFNAHLMDKALESGESMVECPVTFHPRVGISKGGNTGNLRALRVGIRMICGLLFGWETLK